MGRASDHWAESRGFLRFDRPTHGLTASEFTNAFAIKGVSLWIVLRRAW